MNKTVAVAVSGGIDSLFSARRLIDEGYNVIGIHFISGYGIYSNASAGISGYPSDKGRVICHAPVDGYTCTAMAAISETLGIPIHILDLSGIFKEKVVDYFIDQYRVGRTPNPCIVCNPLIKFGTLLEFAQKMGADCLATGHYAQLHHDANGRPHLLKGKDHTKDQSYFLAFLKKNQLDRITFPLGGSLKKEITSRAKELGLSPVMEKESQDVCFIHGDYKDFLSSQPGFERSPGTIVTTEGKTVGCHAGLHSFTIGQRRGINCPAAFPYYVVRLDTTTNTLVVGSKDDLMSTSCMVKDVSWINGPPDHYPADVIVKIRYSHKGTWATLSPAPEDRLSVEFHEPVMSVTPGQAAVFYNGDEVLGGGFIE